MITEGQRRVLTLVLTQFLSTKDMGQIIEDIDTVFNDRSSWEEMGKINGWVDD
jgi:hypothetical protein